MNLNIYELPNNYGFIHPICREKLMYSTVKGKDVNIDFNIKAKNCLLKNIKNLMVQKQYNKKSKNFEKDVKPKSKLKYKAIYNEKKIK